MEAVVLVLLLIIGVLIGTQIWLWERVRSAQPPAVPTPQNTLDPEHTLLRAVIDTSPDAIFVIDRNGKYILSNKVHYTSMGADSMEQVIGKSIGDFYPEDVARYVREEDNVVRRTRTTLKIEVPDPRANNQLHWLQVIKIPILDAQGEVDSISAVVRDITQTKNAQDDLQLRVSQMQLLGHIDQEIGSTLDFNRVTMFALDMLMRISVADAGYIAVMKDNEALEVVGVLGQYEAVGQGTILSPYTGAMGRAVTNQRAIRIMDVSSDADYITQIKDTKSLVVLPLVSQEQMVGIIRLESTRSDRFSDDFYQFAQLVAARIALAVDNSRLYQLVQQKLSDVSRLEQLKTDMIRIASHDLKNPLAIIEGYLMLLGLGDYNLPPDVLDMFDSMKRAADRMNQILLDILSLERINERAKGEFTPFDVAACVVNAFDEYKQQAEARHQTFTLEHTNIGSLMVLGDKAQIYEATTNLISNAIKYTPDNGSVTVSLTVEDNHAVFKVQDTGYGIPEEMQVRLFQPFYRARTEETSNIEGTGLGLHLVKNIIERHDGEMLFKSEYGSGSMFGFRIPLTL